MTPTQQRTPIDEGNCHSTSSDQGEIRCTAAHPELPFALEFCGVRRGESLLTQEWVEVVFFWLGVGVLLPWNAFVTAKPYFQARLCDHSHATSPNIEVWFSILYNGASVLSLAVVLLLQFISDRPKSSIGEKTTTSKQSSLLLGEPTLTMASSGGSTSTEYTWQMVMVPLALYLAVFVFTTFLVFLPSMEPQLFMWLTLSGLTICGVCTSVATSGIVGMAGLFDSNVGVNPFFNGQAAGGLLVAVANMGASMGSSPDAFWRETCGFEQDVAVASDLTVDHDSSPECGGYTEIGWAAAAYFSAACLVLAACMVGYVLVDRYQRVVHINLNEEREGNASLDVENSHTEDEDDVETEETPILKDQECSNYSGMADADSQPQELPATAPWQKDHVLTLQCTASTSFGDTSSSCSEDDELLNPLEASPAEEGVVLSVWRLVQGPAVCLFWTYFVTLALFPVWTSELSSVRQCLPGSNRLQNDLFSPMTFVVFNGGDFVGRLVSTALPTTMEQRIQKTPATLVLASIARFGFFLLFLLCASPRTKLAPWVVQSDWFSWAVQGLFAVTNGALTNLAFGYSPGFVQNEPHHQQVASAILNFSLCLGLTCGSLFSSPFLGLATGAW